MKPTVISKNYRITIPVEIRKQFDLKPGQKLMFIPYQKTLSVVVVPPIQETRGMFKGITLEGIREEVDDEH